MLRRGHIFVGVGKYRCKLNVCPASASHRPRKARKEITEAAVVVTPGTCSHAKPIAADHRRSVRNMPAPHANLLNAPTIRHSAMHTSPRIMHARKRCALRLTTCRHNFIHAAMSGGCALAACKKCAVERVESICHLIHASKAQREPKIIRNAAMPRSRHCIKCEDDLASFLFWSKSFS